MSELRPTTVIQALALFDERNSLDYGLALWAAFHEVESFYRQAGAKVEYRRYYIAPSAPSSSFLESISRAIGRVLPGEQTAQAIEFLNQRQIRSSAAPSAELADSPRRIYDQGRIADVIRRQVDPDGANDHLMIVTDRAITPPSNWRYVIWETMPERHAAVISVAPLDPQYWHDKDPQRVMTIKSRVRSAALSVTGRLVGLDYCENPFCYMLNDVDSVTALDEMRELGKEHHISELDGYGFDDAVKDPASIQRLVRRL